MTAFSNWFDAHNTKHMQAWVDFQKNGVFPQWFFDLMNEEDVEMDMNWLLGALSKLAAAWTDLCVKSWALK